MFTLYLQRLHFESQDEVIKTLVSKPLALNHHMKNLNTLFSLHVNVTRTFFNMILQQKTQ